MPRDQRLVLRRRLEGAFKNHQRTLELKAITRTKLNEAIVSAVNGGITRYEVAQLMGVSSTYVSHTPGLEPNRKMPQREG